MIHQVALLFQCSDMLLYVLYGLAVCLGAWQKSDCENACSSHQISDLEENKNTEN